MLSGNSVDCKPTSSLPYPNGPLSDKTSKAIELVNAEVEKVSHLSKERCTCTCTCKLFYLLATNHTESHFNSDHACDRIIWTIKLQWVKFWRVQIDLPNSPMFSTANVSRYTVLSFVWARSEKNCILFPYYSKCTVWKIQYSDWQTQHSGWQTTVAGSSLIISQKFPKIFSFLKNFSKIIEISQKFLKNLIISQKFLKCVFLDNFSIISQTF